MQSEIEVQDQVQVQDPGGESKPIIKTPKIGSPLLTEGRMEKAGFPPDQVDKLINKLGVGKLTALMNEYESEGDVEANMPRSQAPRGMPRMIPWQSRFYQRCLREMGEFVPGRRAAGLPNATQAWKEIMNQRFVMDREPEFTHPMIVEVIDTFGGWKALWKEFNNLQLPKARLRWIRAYGQMIGD